MRDDRNKLKEDIDECNDNILALEWEHDQQKRLFNDKGLLPRHNRELMGLRQENSLCNIDINIADSRQKDLEAQKEMCCTQLKEILKEKRKIEKENAELEHAI